MKVAAARQTVGVGTDDVLDALEAEAVWCMRETAGAFRRPVLLYSIGKDSSVLLHLARKAFAPAPKIYRRGALNVISVGSMEHLYKAQDVLLEALAAQ